MRGRMLRVKAPANAIDIVGTGGDHSGSYNISTLAAIIVAACGVPVAKHGNRAASSKSGAADVLAALGVKLGLDPAGPAALPRRDAGSCFMFAQTHHAAMRHVAPVRVELGTRTIFNLLGPLVNPAGVKRQLLGVFSEAWLEPLTQVLKELGSERVWAVHGSDGLDEMTTTGPTHRGGAGERHDPPLHRDARGGRPADAPGSRICKGGDPEHNAAQLRAVLDGDRTPYRDIALLNAAAALVIADEAANLRDGLDRAPRALDSGAAKATLDRLVKASNA